MITFITAFKDFIGSDRMAQRSAMWSWWYNRVPVVAVDNEPFIKANCCEFNNVRLVEGIKTARALGFDNACPLINDMIFRCLQHVETPLVALINGDIIIQADFRSQLEKIGNRYGWDVFMTGTRFGVDLQYEINSEETYRQLHEEESKVHNEVNSADIFIASKDTFQRMAEDMPDIILGRYGWDNWIHFWAATSGGVPTLNCTHALKTIHCQHDHAHIEHQEGKPGRKALSSVHNLTLLRNMQNLYGPTVRINKWTAVEI